MKQWFIGAILLLGLIQCKSSQVTENETLIFEMMRTACYGTCPDYEVKIYSNGKVIYQGNRDVPLVGQKTFSLKESDLEQFMDAYNSLDYFSMEDSYTKEVTDLPTTYVTFYKDDRVKKIMDYYGAPDELRNFEDQVQQIIFSYLN